MADETDEHLDTHDDSDDPVEQSAAELSVDDPATDEPSDPVEQPTAAEHLEADAAPQDNLDRVRRGRNDHARGRRDRSTRDRAGLDASEIEQAGAVASEIEQAGGEASETNDTATESDVPKTAVDLGFLPEVFVSAVSTQLVFYAPEIAPLPPLPELGPAASRCRRRAHAGAAAAAPEMAATTRPDSSMYCSSVSERSS